jgi:NAD(P)-dependent dehydrogenase (short-subunit alcohol dehydrogenase family)
MSDINFKNRVAVVTGGGAGLGRLYALELAKRGAAVLVNDPGKGMDGSGSDNKPADTVVAEIAEAGGKAAANYDTVATPEGGENIIQQAVDEFGAVDILINNAGILWDSSMGKMTIDDWDQVQSVHLRGAFCVTKPAMAIMKKKNYGRIILTSSGSGLYGNFGQANYGAAKMGLVGFMNVLGLETAKYDICCNTIAPSAVTRMTENILPDNLKERVKPEFITPLVLYLSSEKNSDRNMIFNCLGGWYSRTAVMCAEGVLLGDGGREITPEEIRENWERITSLDNSRTLGSVAETFGYISSLVS